MHHILPVVTFVVIEEKKGTVNISMEDKPLDSTLFKSFITPAKHIKLCSDYLPLDETTEQTGYHPDSVLK